VRAPTGESLDLSPPGIKIAEMFECC